MLIISKHLRLQLLLIVMNCCAVVITPQDLEVGLLLLVLSLPLHLSFLLATLPKIKGVLA